MKIGCCRSFGTGKKLIKRIAVFPREVDRYKLDIFPHQPFYMTHIYEHDLAWDLGNEVGASILQGVVFFLVHRYFLGKIKKPPIL